MEITTTTAQWTERRPWNSARSVIEGGRGGVTPKQYRSAIEASMEKTKRRARLTMEERCWFLYRSTYLQIYIPVRMAPSKSQRKKLASIGKSRMTRGAVADGQPIS